MLDAEYRVVAPGQCFRSDTEPIEQRPDLDWLMESLKLRGQLVPVLLAPHPDDPDKYIYVDGHGRGWCLGKLGQMMKALVFSRPVTQEELIEFKLSNHLIRRTLSLEEIGLESSRYIELTGRTQQDMSTRFSVSVATISRAIARIKRIPPGCEMLARQLGPSFVSVILTLKTPEQRRLAFEFATTQQTPEGRKPKRDELTKYVDGLKGRKPAKSARKKRLTFVHKGRGFLVDSLPGDTPEDLINAFREIASQISQNRDLKVGTVAAVLADKNQTSSVPAVGGQRSVRPAPEPPIFSQKDSNA